MLELASPLLINFLGGSTLNQNTLTSSSVRAREENQEEVRQGRPLLTGGQLRLPEPSNLPWHRSHCQARQASVRRQRK